MKTFETTGVIGPDRRMIVQLPPDAPVGEHSVIVVVGEPTSAVPADAAWPFKGYPVGLTSDSLTFRREDLYGDPVR